MTMADLQTSEIPDQSDEMPVVPYRVLYTNIPFYSDPQCAKEVVGGKVIILEALDPDDELNELDIVPTSKHYEPGQLVRWNLNNKKMWEESWYKNPETNQIEQAWVIHVEFTGQVLSQQTVQENDELIKKLGANPIDKKQIN